MKKKITLLIAIHSHQPVGNFGWVYEEAYQKAYLPFIQVLKKYPKIKVALHYSGSLYDWFVENKPEYMVVLKELVAKRQAEIMSGGYYEPILPLIPDRDKLGQIKMMSEFVNKKFGYKASGAWIAERVWEPYLPKPLAQSDIKYAIVDDSHFSYAGLSPEEVQGFYLSEEEGHKLCIFPGSEKLRYLIPFKDPQQTVDYLRSRASEEPCAITYADDGEKFGLWPGTYKWVYEEKWLERFFQALLDNQDFIEVITPAEYVSRQRPTGRIYLPCASYKEMLEWSNGFFRNFLVKYPESNNMQKKMLYVSDKLHRVSSIEHQGSRIKDLTRAKRELYMGQCNCAYWHGVFGGLYLNHLRSAIYKHLIAAEKIIDSLSHKKEWVALEETDFDKDGDTEILAETQNLNLYFDPRDGGSLFEIDDRSIPANLTNVLTRRWEKYHEKIKKELLEKASAKAHASPESIHDMLILKEEGLENHLIYDRCRRASLRDHFIPKHTTLDDFIAVKYDEAGDFISQPYEFRRSEKKLVFQRDGNVFSHEKQLPVTVKKTIDLDPKSPEYTVTYEITNKSSSQISVNFGVEYNLSVKAQGFQEKGVKTRVASFVIEDQFFDAKIGFEFDKKADLWHFPIQTVSISESGLERTYQGLCLLFVWPLELAKSKTQKIVIKNTFGEIG